MQSEVERWEELVQAGEFDRAYEAFMGWPVDVSCLCADVYVTRHCWLMAAEAFELRGSFGAGPGFHTRGDPEVDYYSPPAPDRYRKLAVFLTRLQSLPRYQEGDTRLLLAGRGKDRWERGFSRYIQSKADQVGMVAVMWRMYEKVASMSDFQLGMARTFMTVFQEAALPDKRLALMGMALVICRVPTPFSVDVQLMAYGMG